MARAENRLDMEGAERLAVAALGFLARDEGRLARFLAETGLGPQTLRSAAASPGFLAGVLAFVERDEPMLVAFAAEAAVGPESVGQARAVLAGNG